MGGASARSLDLGGLTLPEPGEPKKLGGFGSKSPKNMSEPGGLGPFGSKESGGQIQWDPISEVHHPF